MKFRRLVSAEVVRSKRRVDELEEEMGKHGYRIKEERREQMKQRRILLSTVSEREKAYWSEVANQDQERGEDRV